MVWLLANYSRIGHLEYGCYLRTCFHRVLKSTVHEKKSLPITNAKNNKIL